MVGLVVMERITRGLSHMFANTWFQKLSSRDHIVFDILRQSCGLHSDKVVLIRYGHQIYQSDVNIGLSLLNNYLNKFLGKTVNTLHTSKLW